MNDTVQPYMELMRLDRPVGTLLLLWPTLAALWLAAEGLPPLGLILVFSTGTLLMRSAGCVINDIADRRLDGHVTRTAERPLATGRIQTLNAVVLFFALVALSASLLLFLNPLSRWLALAGLGIYTAVRDSLPQEAWLLFIASMVWIVAYDTMYAMVDREDDLKIGIRSTAILFGQNDRLMIGLMQVTTLVTLLLFAEQVGAKGGLQLGIAAGAVLFIYQQYLIRERGPDACLKAFKNNVWVGFALFAGAVIEYNILPLTGLTA
jgi:4-hydroxybenzoate polyprenyltransferase